MPFKEVTVDTPQAVSYQGKRMASQKMCGVSILRAGETMESGIVLSSVHTEVIC